MSITSSAGPIPMEDGPARLEAYEAMTRQIQAEYQDIARKLEDLTVALVESRYRPKLAMGRRDLVVAALQRRGFAYAVVKEAIKRVEEE